MKGRDSNHSSVSYLESLVNRTIGNANSIFTKTLQFENLVIKPSLSPESLPFNLESPKPYKVTSTKTLVSKVSSNQTNSNLPQDQSMIETSEQRHQNIKPDFSYNEVKVRRMKETEVDKDAEDNYANETKVDKDAEDNYVNEAKVDKEVEEGYVKNTKGENLDDYNIKHDVSSFTKHLSPRKIFTPFGKLNHISPMEVDIRVVPKAVTLVQSSTPNLSQITGTPKKINIKIDHIEIKAVKTDYSPILNQKANQSKSETDSKISLSKYLTNRSRGRY